MNFDRRILVLIFLILSQYILHFVLCVCVCVTFSDWGGYIFSRMVKVSYYCFMANYYNLRGIKQPSCYVHRCCGSGFGEDRAGWHPFACNVPPGDTQWRLICYRGLETSCGVHTHPVVDAGYSHRELWTRTCGLYTDYIPRSMVVAGN